MRGSSFLDPPYHFNELLEATRMPDLSPRQTHSPVLILLGTYNGSEYLSELVRSVRSQTDAAWKMLARDDASTDDTAAILGQMASEYDRLEILPSGPARCGAAGNFAALLQRAAESNARYVFLADQDDVWLPGKIRRQMERMHDAESSHDERTPMLVYSDLTVVDARLKTLHHSFFGQARFRHDDRRALETLLAHNFVPGCSMLLNRPLLDLVVPVPTSAPVHDWWISLCAAAAGRLVFLDEPTLQYRQHGGNLVGARSRWSGLNPLRANWKKRWDRGRANFARHIEQTRALRHRISERGITCGQEMREMLDNYCRLFDAPTGPWRRLDGMHKLGIPRATFLRRLTFYSRVLTVCSR